MVEKAQKAAGFEAKDIFIRIAGSNRYETCHSVNIRFESLLNGSSVCVAKGLDFPDALAGGVLAAMNNSPLLLADNALKDSQKFYLEEITSLFTSLKMSMSSLYFFSHDPDIYSYVTLHTP